MKRFQKWYSRASTEFDISIFTVRVPGEIFCSSESLVTVYFEDLHALYHRKRLDLKIVNTHVGFLHPERITEPSHTFSLDEKNLPEHVKMMTPDERRASVDMKTHEKMLDVAAYIATTLVAVSENDIIYAPYGFNSFKRFFQQLGKQPERKEILCHKQTVGTVHCGYYVCEFLRVNGKYCANYDLVTCKSDRQLDDTSIQNIQRDKCSFIHRECAHKRGRFFDTTGILSLPEYDTLSNWPKPTP
uniref:Ubiquitin-like protease family profile domain-containing protein n=1 Tax=Leersia perrieri TaxID=77586 RepID=A0A0D9X5X9_9ORYZ